ncbi:MAG: hypothetical protein ACRDJU_04330 [Actinomycetota bacterium]
MAARLASDRHVYPLTGSPRRRFRILALLAMLGWGVLALGTSAMNARPEVVRLAGGALVLVAAAAIGVGGGSAMRLTDKLVLTPEGVSKHHLGRKYFTPWSTIIRVGGRARYGIDRDVKGFVLLEPGAGSGVPLMRGERRFIAVSPFYVTDWRAGAFGYDLRRWAPHVVVAGGNPR